MRRNEVEVLAHLRHNRVWSVTLFGTAWFNALFGTAWFNALTRLDKARRTAYRNGCYIARKGAGPVTGAIR